MSLLLDAGLQAEVILDGGWRAPVIITECTPDSALLRPADGHLRLPDRLDWVTATLEWSSEGGTIRRPGILVGAERGLLRLEPVGLHPFEQRRQFERVPAAVSASVTAEGHTVDTTTLDVSAGGMLLDGADGLDAPGPIEFTLRLGEQTVTGTGAIVRAVPSGARAVRFDALNGEGAAALARWLDAHVAAAA